MIKRRINEINGLLAQVQMRVNALGGSTANELLEAIDNCAAIQRRLIEELTIVNNGVSAEVAAE